MSSIIFSVKFNSHRAGEKRLYALDDLFFGGEDKSYAAH